MPAAKFLKLSKRQTAYFFLLINTVCWGAALIAVKPSLDVISPFRFLFYRYLVSALLTIPVLWYYRGKIQHFWSSLGKITLLELLGTTLCLSLLYFGLDRTTAIEASMLASTTPLFVVLLGVLLLKEKQEKRENIGLLIACTATGLLAAEPLLSGQAVQASWTTSGNILILLSNICAALYYVIAKRWYRRLPKIFVTTISFFVGSVSFLLLILAAERTSLPEFYTSSLSDWNQPSVWIAVGYMAIFGSIIGLTAYMKGQDGIEASEASLFSYLQPLIAIPAGILFLQEKTTMLQIISLTAILCGVLIAERRGEKSPRPGAIKRKTR